MMKQEIGNVLGKFIVLAAAMMLMSVSAWANDETPAEIIEQTAGSLLSEINQRREEFRQNPDALTALVKEQLLPMMDKNYSARLILGRHGRGVPAEKIDEFAEALSHALTNRYSSGLLEFRSQEQMEILPPSPKDNERLTRVRTRIKLENGGAAPVDYAFRKTEAGWKVFDVSVEGISYVMTFRNQLGPKVANQGIDSVTEELMSGQLEVSDS